MPIYEYDGNSPKISSGCYIAPSADIIGKVNLGQNVSVWFNSVIRGDVNWIRIGDNSNIQDLSILHVTENNFPLLIGKSVTVGHHVVLHGCTIGNNTLIGMGAVLLDGVKVGNGSLVAAGSLLPPGREFPDGVLIRGNPATVIRQLAPDELNSYGNHYKSYLQTSAEYLDKEKLKVLK